jgi:large subunit ribosomal protein L10
MNRQQKAEVIDFLKDNFSKSHASFIVGFQGLTVSQLRTLRGKLRKNGGKLKVAKARLMKIAAEGMEGADTLLPYCKNQIGVVFTTDQAPAIAKVLSDFSKENEALKLVAGYLDTSFLDSASIGRIASLPSREVLLAQVCGTIKAPTTNFVNVLNVLMLRLLWTLKQVGEKKQQ